MATIQDLKTQIQNANALGRTNLSNNGVELPVDATTYDIMTAIAEIVSGGGGVTYTNIVYNKDNTVTLTDKAGVIHTMSCTYDNGKLIGLTYDGKAVDLTYNGDALVKVGGTDIKLNSTEPSKLQVDNPIATTELTGYEAAKAFDGNVATRWATTANQHRGGVGAEFETPCKIAYARCIKSQYDWKNLTLQCSDDGINWVNASEEIAEPIYDIHDSTTIQSIESGSHKWWRVYSSSCETVSEIEFYGFAVSKQYQNGFVLGLASGGVVESEIPAKEEQEKTITITENGTTEILPDTNKALSKVTVVTNVTSGGGMVPLDNTVTFTVEGETVEIVSVKESNSVNIPVSIKDSNGCFYYWALNGEKVQFPYTPTENVILEGTPCGSLVPTDINEWQKNTVAQSAYIGIDFNGTENSVRYKGVSGYESIYYPVSFKANRRYVFSLTFKTKNLSYSNYALPATPFISVSKKLNTSSNGNQYTFALALAAMNNTPDTEYATYSLTYDSFEEFEGYAVFDTGNITDGINGVLYIKDISLYTADLTNNG